MSAMNGDSKVAVITGSSSGIGLAAAKRFIKDGFLVIGIDINDCPTELRGNSDYRHYIADVRNPEQLPDLNVCNVLVNNAGVQDPETSIDVNLLGLINVTEKYKDCLGMYSIVNLASVSAHNSAEFPLYAASKAGVLGYSRAIAKQLAPRGITVNSLSFGGVVTPLNEPVLKDENLWNAIMEETPMKKWASAEEAAEWIYFVGVVNRSMTAQDIIIDNGEFYNHTFVWPDEVC